VGVFAGDINLVITALSPISLTIFALSKKGDVLWGDKTLCPLLSVITDSIRDNFPDVT